MSGLFFDLSTVLSLEFVGTIASSARIRESRKRSNSLYFGYSRLSPNLSSHAFLDVLSSCSARRGIPRCRPNAQSDVRDFFNACMAVLV